MVKLVILLPHGVEYTPAYVENYNDFLMNLEKLPGAQRKAVNEVFGGPGGKKYSSVIEVDFEDRQAIKAALTSPLGVETGKQLLGFAGPNVVILFVDVLEEAIDSTASEESVPSEP
jgi:hypothetical protein